MVQIVGYIKLISDNSYHYRNGRETAEGLRWMRLFNGPVFAFNLPLSEASMTFQPKGDAVYRHARHSGGNIRDTWDEREEELGRIDNKTGLELAAAGVPHAAPEFVEQTKGQILKLAQNGHPICAQIARQLNAMGVVTANGGRWTDRIVRVFTDRYLPGKIHF